MCGVDEKQNFKFLYFHPEKKYNRNKHHKTIFRQMDKVKITKKSVVHS